MYSMYNGWIFGNYKEAKTGVKKNAKMKHALNIVTLSLNHINIKRCFTSYLLTGLQIL